MEPDPPPIALGYATPRVARPPRTAFSLETFADGVELTRRLGAEPLQAVALVLVALLPLVAVVAFIVHLVAGQTRTGSDYVTATIAGLLLLAIAVRLIAGASVVARRRTLLIRLRGGRLVVVNGEPQPLSIHRWTIDGPRRFHVTGRGVNVIPPQVTGDVSVSSRFRLKWPLVRGLSRDECAWLVAVLNEALERFAPVRGGRSDVAQASDV